MREDALDRKLIEYLSTPLQREIIEFLWRSCLCSLTCRGRPGPAETLERVADVILDQNSSANRCWLASCRLWWRGHDSQHPKLLFLLNRDGFLFAFRNWKRFVTPNTEIQHFSSLSLTNVTRQRSVYRDERGNWLFITRKTSRTGQTLLLVDRSALTRINCLWNVSAFCPKNGNNFF